jgi:putative transposase
MLSKLVSVHGAPQYLRSDNGSELVSKAVLRWLLQARIDTVFIDPGKPWQNGSNPTLTAPGYEEVIFTDATMTCVWRVEGPCI